MKAEIVILEQIDCSLSSVETKQFEELERVIEKGERAFIEIGNALIAIKRKEYYKSIGYTTFENYCAGRWGISRPYADRLISATEIIRALAPMGATLPANERQTRPLSLLDTPEAQGAVWQRLIADGHPITALRVKRAVTDYLGRKTTLNTPDAAPPPQLPDQEWDETINERWHRLYFGALRAFPQEKRYLVEEWIFKWVVDRHKLKQKNP